MCSCSSTAAFDMLTHSPLDLGSSAAIRLRLGPDCGAAPRNEQAPILADAGLLKRARVEESAPGEAMLTIDWSRELHFVLAPTTSGRGLRLRLLDVRAGKARVSLEESDTPVSGYAMNLDSATQPFAPEAIAAAGELLRMPAYVSTLELEGQIWYSTARRSDPRAERRRSAARRCPAEVPARLARHQ